MSSRNLLHPLHPPRPQQPMTIPPPPQPIQGSSPTHPHSMDSDDIPLPIINPANVNPNIDSDDLPLPTLPPLNRNNSIRNDLPSSPPIIPGTSTTSPDPNLPPAYLGEYAVLKFLTPDEVSTQMEFIEKDPKFISLLTAPSKYGRDGPRWNDTFRQVSSKPGYYSSLPRESYEDAEALLTGYGYEVANHQPDFGEEFKPNEKCVQCGKQDSTVHLFFFTSEHVCDSCRLQPQFGITYKTSALKEWKLRPKDLEPLRTQNYPKPASTIRNFRNRAEHYDEDGMGDGSDEPEKIVKCEIYFWRDLRWARARRVLEDREKKEASAEKKKANKAKGKGKGKGKGKKSAVVEEIKAEEEQGGGSGSRDAQIIFADQSTDVENGPVKEEGQVKQEDVIPELQVKKEETNEEVFVKKEEDVVMEGA